MARSGYYTAGIDTNIPWPTEQRSLLFQGHEVNLFPETEKCCKMVRLSTTRDFSSSEAHQLVEELLSALSWSEQSKAKITTYNWATIPIGIGKSSISHIGSGFFEHLPSPPSAKAKLALALYREGLTVNMVPFQFLSFFKIINIFNNKGKAQKNWIREHLNQLVDKKSISRLDELKNLHSDIAAYLYESGRCAVAHSFDSESVANPDNPKDIIRLSSDLPIIQELATIAIHRHFDVLTKDDFHNEHLYELQGFRDLFGTQIVSRLKSSGAVSIDQLTIPNQISLKLQGIDQPDTFESMYCTINSITEGKTRISLGSGCRSIVIFATLDFNQERLFIDPYSDVLTYDHHTEESAKSLLDWARTHLKWAGGNGIVELWSGKTKLGRTQAYIGPANSRFDYNGFKQYIAQLEQRALKPSST